MTDDSHVPSTFAHVTEPLQHEQEDEFQVLRLTGTIDLICSDEEAESGIIAVLHLSQVVHHADLWLLLRRHDDGGVTLAAAQQDLGKLSWTDTEASFATPRHVRDLAQTLWILDSPVALHRFRSMISIPLDVEGEQPLTFLLLSRREAAFSENDLESLEKAGRQVKQAMQNRQPTYQSDIFEALLDHEPKDLPEPDLSQDKSFQTLSRAYSRLARWQGAIVAITNDLLSAQATDSEAAINRALAQSGMLANVDRTYVFRLRGADRIDNTHEWTAPGIEPMIAHLQDMPASLMDEWRSDMDSGRAVHIPDVAALPETSSVRDVLMMQQIHSLLAVPMLRAGKVVGFVGFDAVRTYRPFLMLEIQLLQAVANAVNIVLDRCAAEAAEEIARARLETERNRLKSTLAAMPDLVLELDQDGRFVSYFKAAEVPTAVPADRFLDRLPEEVLPPDLAALARRIMQMADDAGTVTGQEYEMSVGGEQRWFSLSAAAKCEQSKPCGYVFLIRDITDQICQRRRLQRLSKIAELTSNLVIVTDAERQFEWVNPAFERRTGWRLEDVIGKRPDNLLVSEETDRDELRRIGAALRDGKPVRAELLNQTRQGEQYWISKDIQPVFKPDGQIEGFVSVQTDITDIKLSHQKVLHDRAVALDASGDGIAITDTVGNYVYMNVAHRRMFGIDDEADIHAVNWRDLLPQETVDNFIAEHWDSFVATGAWRGELEGRHKDGTLVPQEVTLTLRDNGILCIARDISKRRSMERALHDRAVALDASGDGIAITDSAGHFVYMNSVHRRMFGIRDDEDLGILHWQELYPKETIQHFMAREWDKLQATGHWRGELHGVHRDGTLVQQEVSLALHNDGILCLTRDIEAQLQQAAEQARLREELQRAQRRETIAHLASGIAHDLNNLVAVVAGSVSLLQHKLDGDEDIRASVMRIKRASETARDLVSGLGNLGRQKVACKTHDLRGLITEGVKLLGTRRLNDHALSTYLPETPCPVWANATELLQVIMNLALNACEASTDLSNRVSLTIIADTDLPNRTPDAGLLTQDVRYSAFKVSDSGTGIEAELRPRVFERYFTTKEDTGTGLGLPIVASILRDNGAALWMDSTPGAGTTVTVAWPADPPASTAHAKECFAPCFIEADLTGRNILVVDDLPDVADVLTEFLEARGANAIAVADPQEAADLMQDNPGTWAALVTDLDMPKITGVELARMAKSCNPAIPVVLVTALPESIGHETRPFSAILSKPVQPEELVMAVHVAIRQAETGKVQGC